MKIRMLSLVGLGLLMGCSNLPVQNSNSTNPRTPSSVPNCVGSVCIGDTVYSPYMMYKEPLEVVSFERRFADREATGKPEIDFLVNMNGAKFGNTINLRGDVREVLKDAGPQGCMVWKNNPSLKACVGDTVTLIPLWNYQFPNETKRQLDFYRRKMGVPFVQAQILNVLKMNSSDMNGREDRALVQTFVPGVGIIHASLREIGFTGNKICTASRPDVCVGNNYKTFFGESFTITGYLPAGNNGSSDTEIVITTPVKGLEGRSDFRVNDGFEKLIDPQATVYKGRIKSDTFVQVGIKDSESAAMEKVKAQAQDKASRECSYRIWGRGVLENAQDFNPSFSNCKFSIDALKYAGHGIPVGVGLPRRYLQCEFTATISCVDKDLKK